MVSIEERFQFDLAGFIILRGVLSRAASAELLHVLPQPTAQQYAASSLQQTGAGRPPNATTALPAGRARVSRWAAVVSHAPAVSFKNKPHL